MLADNGTDLDQALTMAQRAKQQRPNIERLRHIGVDLHQEELSDSAIAIFRELVKDEPERATYRYHFAMALYQKAIANLPKRNAKQP